MTTTSISLEVKELTALFRAMANLVDKKAEPEDEVAYNVWLKSASDGDQVTLHGLSCLGDVAGVKSVPAVFGSIGPIMFPGVRIGLFQSALAGFKGDDILNLIVDDDRLGISTTNPTEAEKEGEEILYIARTEVESGKGLSTVSIFNKIAARKDQEEFTLRIDPHRLEALVKSAKAAKSDINLHFAAPDKAIQVNIGETWRGYVTPYEEAANVEDFDSTGI